MSVYTRRIVGPLQIPLLPATAVLYTVPAGTTVVLRSVQILNNSPTLVGLARVGINGLLKPAHVLRYTIPSDTTVNIDLRLGLSAGETLQATSEVSNVLAITVTAYVFD